MKKINYQTIASPLSKDEMKAVVVEKGNEPNQTERWCLPLEESADEASTDRVNGYWECPTGTLSENCCKRVF